MQLLAEKREEINWIKRIIKNKSKRHEINISLSVCVYTYIHIRVLTTDFILYIIFKLKLFFFTAVNGT